MVSRPVPKPVRMPQKFQTRGKLQAYACFGIPRGKESDEQVKRSQKRKETRCSSRRPSHQGPRATHAAVHTSPLRPFPVPLSWFPSRHHSAKKRSFLASPAAFHPVEGPVSSEKLGIVDDFSHLNLCLAAVSRSDLSKNWGINPNVCVVFSFLLFFLCIV